MASHKGTGKLDKSARSAVSGLEWALASIADADKPIQPDEFTALQVFEAHQASGGTNTIAGIRSILDRERTNGKVTVRKHRVNGTICNIYKRAI